MVKMSPFEKGASPPKRTMKVLIAYTSVTLGGIIVHGLYHLSEARFIPYFFYALLNPFFSPTPIGFFFHILMEVLAINALIFAIAVYRRSLPEGFDEDEGFGDETPFPKGFDYEDSFPL